MDDAYWVRSDVSPTSGKPTPVSITEIFFAGRPATSHIHITENRVTFRSMTVFAGHLSNTRAIYWGICGLLRLGETRRIKLAKILRVKRLGHALRDRKQTKEK